MRPDDVCPYCLRPLWMCPETLLGRRWVPDCELAAPTDSRTALTLLKQKAADRKEQRRKEAR